MYNREEQENEVEALECIFVDEFELLFNDPFKYEITLHTDRDDEDLDFIKVKLVIEYPLDYPLVVPSSKSRTSAWASSLQTKCTTVKTCSETQLRR